MNVESANHMTDRGVSTRWEPLSTRAESQWDSPTLKSRHEVFRMRRPRGFTLLEVILAIAIAGGILFVALVFYNQATRLRAALLDESERITSARLLMDRVQSELHCVFRGQLPGGGFSGGSNYIEFVTTKLPPPNAWSSGDAALAPAFESGLRLVRYQLQGSNWTNATGLQRVETMWPKPSSGWTTATSELVAEAADSSGLRDAVSADEHSAAPVPSQGMDVPHLQFARFRYWNGASWFGAWTGPGLPDGVEVTFGGAPVPVDAAPEEYPDEIFQRVIAIPGARFPTMLSGPENHSGDESPANAAALPEENSTGPIRTGPSAE